MHELSHLSLGRDLLPICISITYIFDNKSRSMPSFSNLIAFIETSENSVTRKKTIFITRRRQVLSIGHVLSSKCALRNPIMHTNTMHYDIRNALLAILLGASRQSGGQIVSKMSEIRLKFGWCTRYMPATCDKNINAFAMYKFIAMNSPSGSFIT